MHADDGNQPDGAGLLRGARTGDRAAWEQIIACYTGLVRSVAAEFRLQESDTADVVQSTWLRLFTHAASIREPEKLAGWLATTARREALGLLRRSRPEIASEAVGDGLPTPGHSPEEAVVLAETRAAVRAATDGLPERRRLLVDALFYQPPHTYEEVSRRTGLPVGSIGPTRGRALRELHRRLCEPARSGDAGHHRGGRRCAATPPEAGAPRSTAA